jgi:hypothetical protein
MMKTALVAAALLVGGCVADSGSSPRADSPSASAGSARDDAAYRERSRCQNTMEGGEPKTVCY